MKKMIYLMLALLLVSGIGLAQHRKGPNHQKKTSVFEKYTPEQIATINSKRMALRLDLNSKQQKEVEALELEKAKFKKSKMAERKKEENADKAISEKDHFDRANERLDRQLAYQNSLKNILDDDQYKIWKQDMKDRKKRLGQERMKRKRNSRR
ncbi:hypothetical protein [Spongiivirga citrea]|uniref:DUF4890 domain-containing protein n=1 Tax=Spongiivirga citrea TaxID=1481457 RepID=A0A6M0CT79_9FLAO|nr:hypothetical protein [Spongiivirga citrea]NER18717.1 hypothetical protein [Spongiivirga citrea]